MPASFTITASTGAYFASSSGGTHYTSKTYTGYNFSTSVAANKLTLEYDTEVTVEHMTVVWYGFANSGYTFSSWSTTSTSATCKASAITYSVTLRSSPSGGGSVSYSGTPTYGSYINVTASEATGYQFSSWSDGGAKQHSVAVYGNIDLTAYFNKLYSYKITYSANGGSGAPATDSWTSASTTSSRTLSTTVPTRGVNYRFLGWATSSGATTAQYQPGATVSLTAGQTLSLWAVWKELTPYYFKITIANYINGVYYKLPNAASYAYTSTNLSKTYYNDSSVVVQSYVSKYADTDEYGYTTTLSESSTSPNTTTCSTSSSYPGEYYATASRIPFYNLRYYKTDGSTLIDTQKRIAKGKSVTLISSDDARTIYHSWSFKNSGTTVAARTAGQTVNKRTYWKYMSETIHASYSLGQTITYSWSTDTNLQEVRATTTTWNTITTPAAPTPPTGKKFAYWGVTDANGVFHEFAAGAQVNVNNLPGLQGSCTVYAYFKDNTYKVTINSSTGGSVTKYGSTEAVTPGQVLVASGQFLSLDTTRVANAVPDTNYTFTGWSNFPSSGRKTIDSDFTTTASFTLVNCTVNFKTATTPYGSTGGAITRNSITVEAGSTYTSEGVSLKINGTTVCTAIPYTGYEFTGWSPAYGTLNTPTANITANFRKKSYTITCNVYPAEALADGAKAEPDKSSYYYNETATITATNSAEYLFTKWSDGEEAQSRSFLVTENKSFTAMFEAKVYTLTLNSVYDAYPKEQTVVGRKGKEISSISKIPSRQGYKFNGWYTIDNILRTTIVQSETLYAHWITLHYWRLNYNSNGEQADNWPDNIYISDTETGEKNIRISDKTPVSIHGYGFRGWGTSSTGIPYYQPGDRISVDCDTTTTLYAMWAKNKATLKFNSNGESASNMPSPITQSTSETTTIISIPSNIPVVSEYREFLGWDRDPSSTNPYYGPGPGKVKSIQLDATESGTVTTLYAIWKHKGRITISVEPTSAKDYCTITGEGLFEVEESRPIEIQVSSTGTYTFKKWSDGNTDASRNVKVKEGINNYKAIFDTSSYTIKYQKPNEEQLEQKSVKFNELFTTRHAYSTTSEPEDLEFKFYVGDTPETITGISKQQSEIYKKWVGEVQSLDTSTQYLYKWANDLTLTASNPTSNIVYTGYIITPPAPTAEKGKEFLGWRLMSGEGVYYPELTKCDPNKDTTFRSSKDFVACWGDIGYTVKFNSSGTYPKPRSIAYIAYNHTYLETYSEGLPVTTKKYNKFKGWWYFNTKGIQEEFESNTKVTSNIDCTAKFESKPVTFKCVYDSAGGTPIAPWGPVESIEDLVYTVRSIIPTKKVQGFDYDYRFMGWRDSSTGTIYHGGDQIKFTDPGGDITSVTVTLVAVWHAPYVFYLYDEKASELLSTEIRYEGEHINLPIKNKTEDSDCKAVFHSNGGSAIAEYIKIPRITYRTKGWSDGSGTGGYYTRYPKEGELPENTSSTLTWFSFFNMWDDGTLEPITTPSATTKTNNVFWYWGNMMTHKYSNERYKPSTSYRFTREFFKTKWKEGDYWVYNLYADYKPLTLYPVVSSNEEYGTVSKSTIYVIEDVSTNSPLATQLKLSFNDDFIDWSEVIYAKVKEDHGIWDKWSLPDFTIAGSYQNRFVANFNKNYYTIDYTPGEHTTGEAKQVKYGYDTYTYISTLESLQWTLDARTRFLGFSTRQGGPVRYQPNQSIAKISLNLYGVTEVEQYTLKFMPNGGTIVSGNDTATVEAYKQSLGLIFPKVERAGYLFEYWYRYNPYTGTEVKLDQSTPVNDACWEGEKTVNVYAKWRKIAVDDYVEINVYTNKDRTTHYFIYYVKELQNTYGKIAGSGAYYSDTTFLSRVYKVSIPPQIEGKKFSCYKNQTSVQVTSNKGVIDITYIPGNNDIWVPIYLDAYDFTVQTSNPDLGTVTIVWYEPSGEIISAGPGTYQIPAGSKVIIHAIKVGARFNYWLKNGRYDSTTNPLTIEKLNKDVKYVANFEAYHLYVYSKDPNTGSIACTGATASGYTYGRYDFVKDAVVYIDAYSKNGYAFYGWSTSGDEFIAASGSYTSSHYRVDTQEGKDLRLYAWFAFGLYIRVQPYGLKTVSQPCYTAQPDDDGQQAAGSNIRYYGITNPNAKHVHLIADRTVYKGTEQLYYNSWTVGAANIRKPAIVKDPPSIDDMTLEYNINETATAILAFSGSNTRKINVEYILDDDVVGEKPEITTYGSGLYEKGTYAYIGVKVPEGYTLCCWKKRYSDIPNEDKDVSGKFSSSTIDPALKDTSFIVSVAYDTTYTAIICQQTSDPLTRNLKLQEIRNPYYVYRGNTRGEVGYNPYGGVYNPLEVSSTYGNCTWYAWGRVAEMLGQDIYSTGLCRGTANGGSWFYSSNNIFAGWTREGVQGEYISYYSPGDILCYTNHVEVVEAYNDGKLTISFSGWSTSGDGYEYFKEYPVWVRTMKELRVGESLNDGFGNVFQGVIHSQGIGSPKSFNNKYISLYGAAVPYDAGYVYINGYMCTPYDRVSVKVGDKVTLKFVPSLKIKGSSFKWWDGNTSAERVYTVTRSNPALLVFCNGYDPSTSVAITTAVYPKKDYGSIILNHSDGVYRKGDTVTASAYPAEGYEFVSWSTGETTPDISFTANSNMLLAATFQKEGMSVSILPAEEFDAKYETYHAYEGDILLDKLSTDIGVYYITQGTQVSENDSSEINYKSPKLKLTIYYADNTTYTATYAGSSSHTSYQWPENWDKNKYVKDFTIELDTDDYSSYNAASINSIIVEGTYYSDASDGEVQQTITRYFDGQTGQWTTIV